MVRSSSPSACPCGFISCGSCIRSIGWRADSRRETATSGALAEPARQVTSEAPQRPRSYAHPCDLSRGPFLTCCGCRRPRLADVWDISCWRQEDVGRAGARLSSACTSRCCSGCCRADEASPDSPVATKPCAVDSRSWHRSCSEQPAGPFGAYAGQRTCMKKFQYVVAACHGIILHVTPMRDQRDIACLCTSS